MNTIDKYTSVDSFDNLLSFFFFVLQQNLWLEIQSSTQIHHESNSNTCNPVEDIPIAQ